MSTAHVEKLEHISDFSEIVENGALLILLTESAVTDLVDASGGAFAAMFAAVRDGDTAYALGRRWDYSDGFVLGLRV